jgi:3-phosphoshikimate 1-carboxyvinyltransferase
MTDYLAFPPATGVRGTVAAPPSKSATNRALLLAALSETDVAIEGPLESEDTRVLVRCLAAMGARFETMPRRLRVRGPLAGPADREVALDAGESGTAARFLAAAASAAPGRFLLTGSERLRERPVEELVAALRSVGASIAYAGEEGRLPLAISGRSLRAGRVAVDASRSSQFLSALLLVAPAVEGGLEVVATGSVASAPYVETTVECLRAFGHEVSGGLAAVEGIRVSRGAVTARLYRVPGDSSSALPLLAAAGAAGGRVTVTGLEPSSADADARALPVLERMGVTLERRHGAITAGARRGELEPVSVVATEFPDAVPALAALAALARGESRFEGIAHLRLKESDRIASLAALLTAAGARARALEDALVVEGPAAPRGGAVRLPTFGDHRIAMAAGLLSLALPGLLIENPGCVSKSYPRFFRDLATIRYQ